MSTEIEQVEELLSKLLVSEGFCSAADEATVLSQVIVEESRGFDGQIDVSQKLEMQLSENLDTSQEQAKKLADRLRQEWGQEANDDDDDDDDDDTSPLADYDGEEDESSLGELSDSDDEPLYDGECELCDRSIRLTKHHLIPKSTWGRLEVKLRHAAHAVEKGQPEKAHIILGDGLGHLVKELATEKCTSVRRLLSSTCDICRPCHSAVHNTHSNMDLALHYNTVDKLIADAQIAKFCKWANKQKTGKYALR